MKTVAFSFVIASILLSSICPADAARRARVPVIITTVPGPIVSHG